MPCSILPEEQPALPEDVLNPHQLSWLPSLWQVLSAVHREVNEMGILGRGEGGSLLHPGALGLLMVTCH